MLRSRSEQRQATKPLQPERFQGISCRQFQNELVRARKLGGCDDSLDRHGGIAGVKIFPARQIRQHMRRRAAFDEIPARSDFGRVSRRAARTKTTAPAPRPATSAVQKMKVVVQKMQVEPSLI